MKRSGEIGLSGVGAFAAALAPAAACPACWPAYVALAGSLGAGALTEPAASFPLTVGLLAIAVGPLAYRARSRREFRPLLVGGAGALLLLAGRSLAGSTLLINTGGAILVTAAVWNAWLRRKRSCDLCVEPMSDPNPGGGYDGEETNG